MAFIVGIAETAGPEATRGAAAGADAVRINGTGAADGWLVATGIAFDDPDVFVFEDVGTSSTLPVRCRPSWVRACRHGA
jgi:hypothetical protein